MLLSFPTYRRFLMPLQQMTFENIVTKEEIAHNEQFRLLPHCFQLYSVIKPLFKGIICSFAKIFSKSSAADLLYVGKG